MLFNNPITSQVNHEAVASGTKDALSPKRRPSNDRWCPFLVELPPNTTKVESRRPPLKGSRYHRRQRLALLIRANN